MKMLLKSFLLLFVCVSANAAVIEFVESVPTETTLSSLYALETEQVWLDMINGAENNLELEMFYITNKKGEPLENILNAIKAATARGVKVKILAGKLMMQETLGSISSLKGLENIETRYINFSKVGGGVQHAKFFIVDGKDVFVGSQNFDWRAIKHIHEFGVRIKSVRAAQTFQAVFNSDWSMAKADDEKSVKKIFSSKVDFEPVTKEKPEMAEVLGETEEYYLSFCPEKLLHEGFSVEINELLGLIKGAKKSVSAQVMNYAILDYDGTRWEELDKTLRAAAKRGVKIRLIFADWTMKAKTEKDIKSLSEEKNISIKISSIPQYTGGFIPYSRVDHCKYMLVDGKTSFISTSNWGKSYFYGSRGAAIIIKGSESARVVKGMFEMSWNSPYVKDLDVNKAYQPVKRN
jgi:phospholipase D3/4